MNDAPQGDRPIYQHPLAYLIGLEGVALLRSLGGGYDRAFVTARLAEVERLLARAEELGDGVELAPMATTEGYADWAASYDAAINLLIEIEEPIVRHLLAELPTGVALDAACGTGRHATHLAALGHQVIGVDSAPEMLARARAKLPDATFIESELEALSLPDEHVDLVVCGLALMHVSDLGAVLAEFVRVLRPGGRLIVSDLRGIIGNLNLPVTKRSHAGRPAYIPETARPTSEYISTALSLGLTVEYCEEARGPVPLVDANGNRPGEPARAHVPGQPLDRWALHRLAPEATNAAYLDKPYVLVCQFARPEI